MGAAPRADALAALSGGSTWLSILISCHPNPLLLQFKAGRPCPREQGRKRVPQGTGGTPQAPSNAGAAQEALGVQPCTVGGCTVAEPRVTLDGPLQAASIHRHLNGPPQFPLLASSTPSAQRRNRNSASLYGRVPSVTLCGLRTISPCQELKGDPSKGRGCQPMLQCLEGKAGQRPPGGLARKGPLLIRRLQAGGGSEGDTVADRDQTGSNRER